MLRYELTRWLAYRSICHPLMKWYVWYLPGAAALFITSIYFMLPVRPSLGTETGLVVGILDVLSLLPGFFIAALAAVATFDRPEMDEAMPSPAPTLSIFREGKWIDTELTRRLFLTYLFSYLAILSVLVIIICISFNFFQPTFVHLIMSIVHADLSFLVMEFFRLLFVLLMAYSCSSIVITTLHGMYFISERMHLPH